MIIVAIALAVVFCLVVLFLLSVCACASGADRSLERSSPERRRLAR